MASIFQGDVDTFAGISLGDYHTSTVEFLQNAPRLASESLSRTGQAFMQAAQAVIGKSNIDETMRKMRAAARQVATAFQTDTIRELKTIAELQNAPITMRHLIMACPEVRTMYIDQTIEGYSGLYKDWEPGKVGEDHYDYRRVMDGIILDTNDGFCATEYLEEIREGDELYFDQQVEVKTTWDNVRNAILRGGDDPTSRWNAAL